MDEFSESLIFLIDDVACQEKHIETTKQLLCNNRSFCPSLLFRSLAFEERKKGITLESLYKVFKTYLKEWGGLVNSKCEALGIEEKMKSLLAYYDRDKKGYIGYLAFLDVVLPKENEDLRTDVLLEENRIQESCDSEPEISERIWRLFSKLVIAEATCIYALFQGISQLSTESKGQRKFSELLGIDKEEFITCNQLCKFISSKGINSDKKDMERFVRRLLCNEEKQFTYFDLLWGFHEESLDTVSFSLVKDEDEEAMKLMTTNEMLRPIESLQCSQQEIEFSTPEYMIIEFQSPTKENVETKKESISTPLRERNEIKRLFENAREMCKSIERGTPTLGTSKSKCALSPTTSSIASFVPRDKMEEEDLKTRRVVTSDVKSSRNGLLSTRNENRSGMISDRISEARNGDLKMVYDSKPHISFSNGLSYPLLEIAKETSRVLFQEEDNHDSVWRSEEESLLKKLDLEPLSTRRQVDSLKRENSSTNKSRVVPLREITTNNHLSESSCYKSTVRKRDMNSEYNTLHKSHSSDVNSVPKTMLLYYIAAVLEKESVLVQEKKKMTRLGLDRISRIFASIHKRKYDSLNLEEFKQLICSLGYSAKTRTFIKLFDEHDSKNRCRIDFKGFLKMVSFIDGEQNEQSEDCDPQDLEHLNRVIKAQLALYEERIQQRLQFENNGLNITESLSSMFPEQSSISVSEFTSYLTSALSGTLPNFSSALSHFISRLPSNSTSQSFSIPQLLSIL